MHRSIISSWAIEPLTFTSTYPWAASLSISLFLFHPQHPGMIAFSHHTKDRASGLDAFLYQRMLGMEVELLATQWLNYWLRNSSTHIGPNVLSRCAVTVAGLQRNVAGFRCFKLCPLNSLCMQGQGKVGICTTLYSAPQEKAQCALSLNVLRSDQYTMWH